MMLAQTLCQLTGNIVPRSGGWFSELFDVIDFITGENYLPKVSPVHQANDDVRLARRKIAWEY